ncbi:MAG: antibiotic biosynthesis monooxygenase [Anaerolineae bacterium]
METVLIDLFVVPQESVTAFMEQAERVQTFIKTLPGYVEGYVYQRSDGDSPYNFMTTAVWQSAEAFENAKRAVAAENQKRNFNAQVVRQQLGVTTFRSTFERSPY